MDVQLFILVISCLFVTVRSEDACGKWKEHPNFHLLPSEDECGKVKINQELASRILNGRAAEHGSLPWMAYIYIEHGGLFFICGGSVINENYILTAAHCFRNFVQPKIKVFLGLRNSRVFSDGTEEYEVSKHIIHQSYDPQTLKNDIALIQLKTKINLKSDYINSICLPTTCELAHMSFIGVNVTTAGWGNISYGQMANALQKVVLEVKKCDDFGLPITNAIVLTDQSHLCAGDGYKMVCAGDSGGPAMYERNDKFIQVGISQMGLNTDCTLIIRDEPSTTFIKVAPFMDWILETIMP